MENANGVIKKLTSAERSYYTAAEVREMMGVSRDTAYRMIRYLERGSYEIGSEIVFVGIFGIALFGFLNWFIGGDEH